MNKNTIFKFGDWTIDNRIRHNENCIQLKPGYYRSMVLKLEGDYACHKCDEVPPSKVLTLGKISEVDFGPPSAEFMFYGINLNYTPPDVVELTEDDLDAMIAEYDGS